MSEFETVHRELRTAAGGFPYADEAAAVAAEQAEDRLRDFHGRTGPLVDAAIAAAREMVLLGAHDGLCDFSEGRGCSLHIRATQRRERALHHALAALDKAARG